MHKPRSRTPHRYPTRQHSQVSVESDAASTSSEMAPQEAGSVVKGVPAAQAEVEMAPQEDLQAKSEAQDQPGRLVTLLTGTVDDHSICVGDGSFTSAHSDLDDIPLPPDIQQDDPPADVSLTEPLAHPEINVDQRQYRYRHVRRSQPTQWGYVGDHSVEISGCRDQVLAQMEPPPILEPNFIRRLWARVNNAQPYVFVANNAVVMHSSISQSENGGGFRQPVGVQGPVILTSNGPLPPEQLIFPEVRWIEGYTRGELPETEINRFLVGGVPCEKTVQNAIQPKLHIANVNVARALAGSIDKNTVPCNNAALYAKLIWHALVLDLFEYIGEVPFAIAYPPGFDINYVDLNQPQLDYLAIANPINRKDIILVERQDFNRADLPALMWLTKPGPRVTGGPHIRIPHAAYVSWPGINITVLTYGPPDPEPPVQVIPANTLLAFARTLCNARGEWSSFQSGLYWVLDNIGIQLRRNRDRRWSHITPHLVTHHLQIPIPQDFNVLLRTLGVLPVDSVTGLGECNRWLDSLSNTRVDIAVAYSACIGSFVTTVLYSLQITTPRLIEWCTGLVVPPMTMGVLNSINSVVRGTGGTLSSPIFDMVQSCFMLFVGLEVCRDCREGEAWLSSFGTQMDQVDPYHTLPQLIPPRFYNPLVVDNLLAIRPKEWGMTGPCPTVDFSHEVRLHGAIGHRGWFGMLGDKTFGEAIQSQTAYMVIPYGPFAANIITQLFRPQAQLLSAVILPMTRSGMVIGQDIAPLLGPVYMPALAIFEPCTVMTFDSVHNNILATAIVDPQIAQGDINALSRVQGRISNAGFSLCEVAYDHFEFIPPPFASRRNFRLTAPAAQAATATE